ncbi:hypothetical protein ANN_24833 [Periplaneta americana]|uniref:Mos1 transposase HTH domain-containing protein n=1 Tax=Periplaneta americana TaxID=6978 RepID=A0ABQ8RZU7_PERAM|nr:hypothetical protein ANN_24833 [Periplaneta americana]
MRCFSALDISHMCERPKTTFTKLEQRSWIKIEVTRGRSAQGCFQGLRKACADAALPYRTVARWVKAFREGRDAVQDNLRTGRPRVEDNTADGKRGLLLQHHLRPPLRRKRRHLVVQNPIILHDNARSHTTAAVKDLLRRWQWEILEHPQYSPDMSPCDYDLFTKVKEPLRGTRYNTRDELIRSIGRSIRNINKDGRADGVRRLPNIWQKVISKGGDYIEGENADEMSPGHSTESYPAFAQIGLRENPGKNLIQITCPDRDSNPAHLVSRPDALTVTLQIETELTLYDDLRSGFLCNIKV